MSQRSKREHKPTSKFLSYKTQELSPTDHLKNKRQSFPPKSLDTPVSAGKPSLPTKHIDTPKNKRQSFAPKSLDTPGSVRKPSLPTKHIDTPFPSRNVNSSAASKTASPSIRKGAAIHGRRKLATDKVEVLCVSAADSSPEITEKSPEIRRTNRQHKPNAKLKEFIDLSSRSEPGPSISSSKTPNPQNAQKKVTNMFQGRSPSKKSQATAVASDESDREKSSDYSKRLSIGLVDCFEGLTKDLAKHYPRSSEKVGNSVKNNDNVENDRRGMKRSLNKDMEDSYKSPSIQKQSYNEPLAKRERLTPTAVRNLTKTKKSTKVTTVIETVDLTNNKREKTITRNKKLKVTKQYPLRNPVSIASSSKEISSPKISSPKLSSSSLVPKHSFPQVTITTPKSSMSPVVLNQPKDIREVLKKFLIMGTKVANAISETLKQNEETLLSKSSTFEKKCLSLVHALARQGTDLEEDDMEKVLKLLDEEQDERRAYRRTLLESLRASHLTNMALYNQTLGLLKTL